MMTMHRQGTFVLASLCSAGKASLLNAGGGGKNVLEAI